MRRGWGEVQPLLNNHVTTQPRNQKQGFSLIELSIVLVVIGIILASVIPVASAHVDVKKIETTRDKLDVIQKALNVHVILNKGLPCPASKTALPDTANFGVATDCEAAPVAGVAQIGTDPNYIRIGAVPVRTLNLPEHIMLDSWSNRFTYAVTKAATGAALPNGIIDVVDANNNPIITPAASATYVVFSSGKDGKGTHRRRGEATAACNTGAKDGENCDGDITFRDTAMNDGTNASLYFDDLVLWKTTPMIKDETGALAAPPEVDPGTEVAGENWSTFRGVVAGITWSESGASPGCTGAGFKRPVIMFDSDNATQDCCPANGMNYCQRVVIPNDISRILISAKSKGTPLTTCRFRFGVSGPIYHLFNKVNTAFATAAYDTDHEPTLAMVPPDRTLDLGLLPHATLTDVGCMVTIKFIE